MRRKLNVARDLLELWRVEVPITCKPFAEMHVLTGVGDSKSVS